MDPVQTIPGDGPIVLGQPHGGTYVPPDIRAHLNETGRALSDTDWHIARLFEGLLPQATTVRARTHRYVIDANRDPSGASLYPGQNTTSLVPLTDFDGTPIWTTQPTPHDINHRRATFHAPYHAALKAALERTRARHGIAILFDCHSIRAHIPFLFEGTLPTLNIGTNRGTTCAAPIEHAIAGIAAGSGFTHVTNGRFRGGWTTRHYGRPDTGIHAIQLEIAQSAYMLESPPWTYAQTRAARLRTTLSDMLHALSDLALTGDLT